MESSCKFGTKTFEKLFILNLSQHSDEFILNTLTPASAWWKKQMPTRRDSSAEGWSGTFASEGPLDSLFTAGAFLSQMLVRNWIYDWKIFGKDTFT